jgi:hypothetical protein
MSGALRQTIDQGLRTVETDSDTLDHGRPGLSRPEA